ALAWATARKTHPCVFLLIRFSKTFKGMRPPGFFGKIGNRPAERDSAPTENLPLGMFAEFVWWLGRLVWKGLW
ncbi:MAG TPA: hypothetical protein VK760_12765, partial [Candidatus Acidoferrales bacterium]|nr:hypothetical protein [Candidatus Acidoferrales bacterium]